MKPVSRGVIIATALVLMVVVFPVVRGTRDVALSERGNPESGIASLLPQQNPVTFTLEELGGSLSTVAYTIELVPEARQFDYGLGYLQSALTIIPNVFGELHPALARGTPTRWLVRLSPRLSLRLEAGSDTHSLQKLLNFGFWRPIVLFLIEFPLRSVRNLGGLVNDPVRIVAVGSFLAFFLVFPRGDSTNIMRPLIWYSLLVYVLVLSLRREEY